MLRVNQCYTNNNYGNVLVYRKVNETSYILD